MAKAKKSLFSISDKSMDFLRTYMNTASPVGSETAGQKVWLNYIKNYVDDTFTDPYGTAVGVVNPGKAFKVVIEAHADEISWFVNYYQSLGADLPENCNLLPDCTFASAELSMGGKSGERMAGDS